MKKLNVAALGCGERARIYCDLMMTEEQPFEVVAGADVVPGRVEKMRVISRNPDFRGFASTDELLAQDKLADMVIVATQDIYHFEHCKQALLKGYDVMLEKPAATEMAHVVELGKLARELGRRIIVCFVLRYTPFYRTVKEVLNSGRLGDIISLSADEGVTPWHFSHAFVRGHWSIGEKSSPMIVAKCCHDTDMIHWLIGKECKSIASFGELKYYKKENAPEGATTRCTDGCPHAQTCKFSALRFASDKRFPWLPQVFDRAHEAEPEEIIEWLKTSPWGRCVYHCDNNVADHQVMSMEFEEGITAEFSINSFNAGRHIEIFGTKGRLKGGEFYKEHCGFELCVEDHEGNFEIIEVPEVPVNDAHGGGDSGLICQLYELMTSDEDQLASASSIHAAVHSHLIAFAAEQSRLEGKVIKLEHFTQPSI